MALSSLTTRSRRFWNSLTMACVASCGPSRAAMPAACVKAAVQLEELVTSREIMGASEGGKTP